MYENFAAAAQETGKTQQYQKVYLLTLPIEMYWEDVEMLKVKRVLSLILALVMCCVLFSMAVSAEGAVRELYVSAAGSDEAAGTQDAPLASLAKAADIVNKDENGTAFVIHVVDDLTATACARFYNHDVTIVGDGETAPVVTRGEGFRTQSDPARSWYNPAMIEVAGYAILGDDSEPTGEHHKASLRLENITLDDNGIHAGSQFMYASSDGTGQTSGTSNTEIVQDAIISTYNGVGTIILGKGTTLKNFGGMTAIYDAGAGTIIMENGSLICDDTTLFTISTPADGQIRRTEQSLSAIHLCGRGARLDMQAGSKICDLRNASALNIDGTVSKNGEIVINGVISGIQNNLGNTPSVRQAISGEVVLGKDGKVINNTCTFIGGIYVRQGSTIRIYGEISGNAATDERGGGLYLISGTGGEAYAYLEDGAIISNNTCSETGGGIMVNQGGRLIMNGGTISGNHANGDGGGISVRRDATFVMNGGIISDNTANGYGSAICLDANSMPNASGYFQLNGGELTNNSLAVKRNGYAHLDKTNGFGGIASNVKIDDAGRVLSFEQDSKTITPAVDSLDIKLGNASTESNHALTRAANEKGWNTPLATFWVQRDSAAVMTVGGLTLEESLPQIVYALVQETGEDGKPLSGAEVKAYNTQITAKGICVTLPNGTENGYAVALVQPKADLGRVVITTTKPELNEDKDLTGSVYEVPYTATYTMSDNLLNLLKLAPRGVPMTFVVELDSRLTAKTDADGRFLYTFDGDGVLNVDESQITVSADGHTITVVCTPVDDWVNALKDKTSVVMTLNGTGLLAADDFKAGDYLNTTGHIEGTVPAGAGVMTVMIPANVCRQKMIGKSGEEPIVDPTVPFIPAFLLGEEHEAYVSGYPDGTVRPESNITRAEVAAMLYRLLPGRTASSGLYSFRDVTTDKWYYSAVSVMTDGGYINGYSDGTFRGENAITRAEFVAMLTRFMGARACGSCGFTDVSAAHWAYDSIAAASANGWITGYPDGSFRPERPITRAEAMAIINRALNRGVDKTSWLGSYVEWPDNHRSAWYYYEVIEATNNHYYTGSRPSEDWTEAGR